MTPFAFPKPLPFSRAAVTLSGAALNPYKYVELNSVNGDDGLSEACRLWWLSKKAEAFLDLNVSGYWPGYLPPYNSKNLGLLGAGGDEFTASRPEPKNRCSINSTPLNFSDGFLCSSDYSFGGVENLDCNTPGGAYVNCRFYLAFILNKWCLLCDLFVASSSSVVLAEGVPDLVSINFLIYSGDSSFYELEPYYGENFNINFAGYVITANCIKCLIDFTYQNSPPDGTFPVSGDYSLTFSPEFYS